MAHKYKFNTDNFDYKKESKASKLSKIILTELVAVFFLALVVFYILSYSTDSVTEKNLKHENKILSQEYKRLYNQYLLNEKNLKLLEMQDTNLYKVIFGASQLNNSNEKFDEIHLAQGRKAYRVAKRNNQKLKELDETYISKRKDFIAFIDSLKGISGKINTIPSILPLPDPDLQFLIYGFGRRLDPIYHIPMFHSGIDIKAPFGTPVFATADGTVVRSIVNDKLNGDYVLIKHGDYQTGYYHLEKHIVRDFQKVVKGQVIGYVGTSGRSLIEHLHYEIKYKGKAINPIFYFFTDVKPSQYPSLYQKSITAGITLD